MFSNDKTKENKNVEQKMNKENFSTAKIEEDVFVEPDRHQLKGEKLKFIDRKMGSLRGNYSNAKTFFQKHSLLDSEMGSVRSNWQKLKMFFSHVFSYVKSFFTKEKFTQMKDVFSYKSSKDVYVKKYDSSTLSAGNELKH